MSDPVLIDRHTLGMLLESAIIRRKQWLSAANGEADIEFAEMYDADPDECKQMVAILDEPIEAVSKILDQPSAP